MKVIGRGEMAIEVLAKTPVEILIRAAIRTAIVTAITIVLIKVVG